MREIKFRAWDESTKTMHTMDRNTRYENTLRAGQILERFDCVSQSTGLHDKHGVDIYEGDILKFSRFVYDVRVVWAHSVGRWYMLHHGGEHDSAGCNVLTFQNSLVSNDGGYEIIGNVFESGDYTRLTEYQ